MRIHNQDNDTKVDKVTIFLTLTEAKTFQQGLIELIEEPKWNHKHISSDDYKKEITICIYDPSALDEYGFHERAIKLIREDS